MLCISVKNSKKSERKAKYINSYSGYALDLCVRSVHTNLVLFCSRHWDERNDVQSIPLARNHAERALDEIIERHSKYFDANKISRNAQEFRKYFERLSSDVEKAGASPTRRQIRVLRTEHYAHLTANSKDRNNALSEDSSFNMDDLNINSLLSFARQTIEIGERFLYLQKRLSTSFDQRVAHISGYYDIFWNNLPVFSEVEGPI